jgi:hypothetical protein
MAVVDFFEPETAPFASCGSINVSFVELDVLDWMSKSHLMHTCASRRIPRHHHDGQIVNKFLSIRLMSHIGNLKVHS